jgi:hypothetical protein
MALKRQSVRTKTTRYRALQRITEKAVSDDGTEKTIEKDKDNKIQSITEKTVSNDGTINAIRKVMDKDNNIIQTEKTISKDGTGRAIVTDKDNKIHQTFTFSKEGIIQVDYSDGKPSHVTHRVGGNLMEEKKIAPDDSFTKTLSYEPGSDRPTKVVTDYRDPPRQVTETFDNNIRTVSDYNPQDGWTTTKSTDQRTGSTTTEITKTNPDGSISTKNPDDNTITTRNADGTWFMTFPPSQDGSVKTYHSDGRTTIEKPK